MICAVKFSDRFFYNETIRSLCAAAHGELCYAMHEMDREGKNTNGATMQKNDETEETL